MKCNVGKTDKVVSMVLALAIGALGIYFIPIAIGIWGLLAVLPLFPGLISFCPVYTILGLNTCTPKRVQ